MQKPTLVIKDTNGTILFWQNADGSQTAMFIHKKGG